jgi:hypothetical protein
MTVEVPGGPKTASLIERVKNILLTPGPEWDRIDGETATVKGLFTGYAAILAAIPAICSLLSLLLFIHFFAMTGLILDVVLNYVLTLVAVFVLGFAIDALAPSFGGTKSPIQGMKVAVYSATAGWVGGVLLLVPVLGWLAYIVVALYGLYILWLGLPKLMKVPQDKAPVYFVVVLVVALIVFGIASAIPQRAMFWGAGPLGGYGANTITFHGRNGSASINLNQVAAVTNQIKAQAAAQQAAANGSAPPAGTATVTPVGADVLRNMLPGSINGMARGDISSSSGSAMGIAASEASATYTNGNAHLTLKVSDTGTASGVMGLAGALNVNSDEQNGSHYKKVSTVNGNMITEDYDNATHSGSYMTVVAGRFAVEADGTGVDINTMKAAVNAVPQGQLASMKNH